MNLEKYITDLLYRHQCVVVPGFGGFLTENISAQIIDGSHNFYPPKKLISFNANLKNNDGLLANHVALSEKIDYNNAVQLIDNEVAIWLKNLDNNDNIVLKNIGTLALNFNKNIFFEPADNFNYLKTSFGLSAFVSPDVKRAKILKQEQTVQQHTTQPQIISVARTRDFSNLKYAAIFLIGCGIASPVFFNLYKQKQSINNMLLQANVQKQVKTKIQEATFIINNPLENIGSNAIVTKNFHVVAGAFKIESNADKICKQLLANGYNAKKISPNNNGLFPVVYDSYSTYADARNAMLKIQLKNNADAWVLIQELE